MPFPTIFSFDPYIDFFEVEERELCPFYRAEHSRSNWVIQDHIVSRKGIVKGRNFNSWCIRSHCLFPFYRTGNGSSEKWSNFLKAICLAIWASETALCTCPCFSLDWSVCVWLIPVFFPLPYTAFSGKHPFSCWLNSCPPLTPCLSPWSGDSISTFAKISNTCTQGMLAAIIKRAFFSTIVILTVVSTEISRVHVEPENLILWSLSLWAQGPGVLQAGVRQGQRLAFLSSYAQSISYLRE